MESAALLPLFVLVCWKRRILDSCRQQHPSTFLYIRLRLRLRLGYTVQCAIANCFHGASRRDDLNERRATAS